MKRRDMRPGKSQRISELISDLQKIQNHMGDTVVWYQSICYGSVALWRMHEDEAIAERKRKKRRAAEKRRRKAKT